LQLGGLDRGADRLEGCKEPPARLAIQVSQPLLLEERETSVYAPANLHTALLIVAKDQLGHLQNLGGVSRSLHAKEALEDCAAASAEHNKVADRKGKDRCSGEPAETDAPGVEPVAKRGRASVGAERLNDQYAKNGKRKHKVQNARNGTPP
jgi:hypothetical protein